MSVFGVGGFSCALWRCVFCCVLWWGGVGGCGGVGVCGGGGGGGVGGGVVVYWG